MTSCLTCFRLLIALGCRRVRRHSAVAGRRWPGTPESPGIASQFTLLTASPGHSAVLPSASNTLTPVIQGGFRMWSIPSGG